MSTPISNGLGATLLALSLLLGGCVEQGTPDVVSASDDAVDGAVEMRRVVLERDGRNVAIAPPRGMCLDSESLHEGAVIAGDCAAFDVRTTTPSDTSLSLMTASVSTMELPGRGSRTARAARLETMLHSGTMSALLAEQDGIARLIETRLYGDSVFALLEDNASVAFDGASRRYWRVISEENDRMIILTVRALEAFWPGEQALLTRAVAFRESVRRANRGAV